MFDKDNPFFTTTTPPAIKTKAHELREKALEVKQVKERNLNKKTLEFYEELLPTLTEYANFGRMKYLILDKELPDYDLRYLKKLLRVQGFATSPHEFGMWVSWEVPKTTLQREF